MIPRFPVNTKRSEAAWIIYKALVKSRGKYVLNQFLYEHELERRDAYEVVDELIKNGVIDA